MEINRIWAMPDSNTFNIKPIRDIVQKYIQSGELWIDGFANTSKMANVTNDLNPNYDTDYHMDALDFFKMFEDNSVDGVLYDPPYSLAQTIVTGKHMWLS